MQSRKASFIEAVTNTVIAYLVSIPLNIYMVEKMTGERLSVGQSFSVVFVFTVVSFIRTYLVRRMFARTTEKGK